MYKDVPYLVELEFVLFRSCNWRREIASPKR